MPTAQEWAEYFYPFLFDGEDSRYVTPSDFAMALAVAVDFRPSCLTADRQNQAQAHYAAYVSEFRDRLKSIGISSTYSTETVSGPIVEKQEGDVRVKYSESKTSTSGSSAAIKAQLTGPGTAYAAWQALWEICVPATDGTGTGGTVVVPKGAMITRFGYNV